MSGAAKKLGQEIPEVADASESKAVSDWDGMSLDTAEIATWIEEFQEALLPPTPDDVRGILEQAGFEYREWRNDNERL